MKECKKCTKPFEPSKGLINYCSLKCRNGKIWSESDKLKKSVSAKNSKKLLEAVQKLNIKRSLNSKKINLKCIYCDTNFQSYHRKQKYCNKVCFSKDPNKGMGGYREGSGRAKSGRYKGIYCGSSYELAWVIYQLDHNVDFDRFNGSIEGEGIKYIPDFIIGNTIYEMKGYESDDKVSLKTNLAISKGYEVKVLRKNDLVKEFEWVKQNYNYTNIWDLYDGYKPKYEYTCSTCSKKFSRERKVKTENKYCSRSCIGKRVGKNNKAPNRYGFNQYKKNPQKHLCGGIGIRTTLRE